MVELVFSTDHAKNSFWWLKNVMKNGNPKNQVRDLSAEGSGRKGASYLDKSLFYKL